MTRSSQAARGAPPAGNKAGRWRIVADVEISRRRYAHCLLDPSGDIAGWSTTLSGALLMAAVEAVTHLTIQTGEQEVTVTWTKRQQELRVAAIGRASGLKMQVIPDPS